MKVGILTLPLKGNYGGVLQAYALLTFLKNKGIDAYLVDRQWDTRANTDIKYHLQKFIFHNIIRGKVKSFCDTWINPKTSPVSSQEEMLRINDQNFDAFIVGSDQVWRLEHISGVKDNFFLDFVKDKNVKKISYAASFGKDSVDGSKEYLNKISDLLKDFDAISVREDSGIKICKEFFDVTAVQVLDPVLLLSKEDYLKIISSTKTKSQILTNYVLDKAPEKLEIIDRVANNLSLKINSINYKKDPGQLLKGGFKLDFYNYIYPSLKNWLAGFRDADFIVTDSFHGMLFSVIFNKQFLIIGNEKRGLARFYSFLRLINLEHRLITSKNPFKESLLNEKINFLEVNEKINSNKNKATDFLLNNLSNK